MHWLIEFAILYEVEMYQIRLDDAYLLALKADTNLAQSGGKQMLMFEGKSSQSSESNWKPKMYSKYQPKLALKGCAGGQIVKMVKVVKNKCWCLKAKALKVEKVT